MTITGPVNPLIHARIVIGHLLQCLSSDNADCKEHWSHKYREFAGMMVEMGSRGYPGLTIADHLNGDYIVGSP